MTKQDDVRRLYSPAEAFGITCRAFRAIPVLSKARRKGTITPTFQERLMLAVTEVNGCAICSYAHTKMALEAGMTGDEIAAMLAGEARDIPGAELPAILFAQHYADNRGRPSPEAWQRVVSEYGEERARAILAAIQIIMMGNTYGIPLGSLRGRFARKPEQVDARSTPAYEALMLLLFVIYLPLGLVTALLAELLRRPPFAGGKPDRPPLAEDLS